MKLFELYFSPTGGTKKVADILASAWGKQSALEAWHQIDFTMSPIPTETELNEEDICIIAVPCYGGRVPALAAERMKELKGNHARAILVAVFGNRAIDDTLLEMKDIMETAGFRCIAGIQAVAEHSIFRQYGTRRPDLSDAEELRRFVEEIQVHMEFGEEINLNVPGNRPYKEYNGVPMKPYADRDCKSCGVCAKNCPVQAISFENPKIVEEEKCISCMRCITVCPAHARRNKWLLMKMAGKKMGKALSGRKDNALFL